MRIRTGLATIPSIYQEVEYIQSTGTQYIDIDYICKNNNIIIELDMAWTGSSIGAFETFIGFMYSTSQVTPRLGLHKYSSKLMFGVNATTTSSVAPVSGERFKYRGEFISGAQKLYKNDTLIANNTTSFDFSTNTCPTYIFSRYCPGSQNYSSMKLYSCKIWANNILVRDLVPCYKKADNTIGLYDKISNSFYYNGGTGTFGKGNNISPDSYRIPYTITEGTVNLGGTSKDYSNKTNGQSHACSGWGGDAGTVTFYHSGGYNNYPYKVYHKTATGSGGIYTKTADDIVLTAGKTYTMSVYIKASVNISNASPYSFNINSNRVTSGSTNVYINYGTNFNITTEWQRLEKTFTVTSSNEGSYGEMSIIYDDTITDYYIYYSGFQIEEKDHATPYVNGTRPNSAIYVARPITTVEGTTNLFGGGTDFSKTNKWTRSQYNSIAPTVDSDGNMTLYGYDTSGNHQSYTVSSARGYTIISPLTTYTLSVYVKYSSTNAYFNMYFYERTDSESVKMNYWRMGCTADEVGKWVLRSKTITTQETTTKMYTELNCYNCPATDYIILKNHTVQLEAKDHRTLFTDGTRADNTII